MQIRESNSAKHKYHWRLWGIETENFNGIGNESKGSNYRQTSSGVVAAIMVVVVVVVVVVVEKGQRSGIRPKPISVL
jgi:hypothetical protein